MRPRSRLTAHQSKKFSKDKHLRIFLLSFLYLLITCLIVFVFSRFSYIKALTITNVSVSGAEESVSRVVQNQALRIISGSYWGIFSKANAFLYPRKTLVANIQSSLPQIQNLTVSRNDFNDLQIDIIEKKPIAKICPFLPEFDDNRNIKISGNCYYSDQSGQIFDIASSTATSSINVYFTPALSDSASSSQNILLSYATSTKEFTALQNFYDGTKSIGLRPTFILIKEGGEYEMYIDGVIIYFNNLHSLDEQLANLISFWNYELNKKYINNPSSRFEYIDVRYESNVFYRLIQ